MTLQKPGGGATGIIDTTIPMLVISHCFRLVVFGIPSLSLQVLNLFVFTVSILATLVQTISTSCETGLWEVTNR